MTADRWVGQVLGGRYKIEELLGQGGMSAVYKARDPNLQRTVAIKLIHSHLSNNEDFVRRFETEATAVARLRHPNIVQVYDFNHDGDTYYMVLEYVAGETLQSRIKRMNQTGRRIPVRDALHYISDVCKAADYAHQRGLIHRDIKPANVMLDVNGNAILMDFGIAHILGGQQHTATGAVLGTALYMSPEQIQGLHPDARSDIYSIGVTLFETLGGRPPFEADSVMTLMMMHLNDPVPDINQLHPGIPEAVRAVVNRSLEKDRVKRFQTCAEMASALDNAIPTVSETAAAAPAAMPPAPEVKPAPQVESTRAEAAPLPSQTLAETKPPAESYATIVEPVSPAAKPTPAYQEPLQGPPDAAVYAPTAPGISRSKILIGVAAAVLILALLGGGAVILGMKLLSRGTPTSVVQAGGGTQDTATVEAVLPPATDTPEPSPTATEALPPTETPTEAPTATATTPALTVVGGADQLGFILNSDIWVAGVDGSGARQVTTDGASKNYLRWLPDGSGFSYISGKCIQTADLQGVVTTVTCFNNASYLDSFEVSPDGTRVALSVDRQLYLIPFDLTSLAEANSHSDLTAMSDCEDLAPYQRNAAYSARWSKDGSLLAAVTMGVLSNGTRGDIVQVFAVDQCIVNPKVQLQFPQPHFTFSEYTHEPTLYGFSWDGASLFVMNGNTRNDGFGNLHIFNWETYKAISPANPIDGKCCYRSPSFSPDGNYLLFAFQDISQGVSSQTLLYYIPFGTLGTGVNYEPLPLPAFSNPKENPQAVLRPAK